MTYSANGNDFEVHLRGTNEELRNAREFINIMIDLVARYPKDSLPLQLREEVEKIRVFYIAHNQKYSV